MKDLVNKAGIGAILLIMSFCGAQLMRLVDTAQMYGQELVGMKKDITHNTRRIDKVENAFVQVKDSHDALDKRVVKVEAKVFPFHN